MITDAATGLELTAITVSLRNTASGLVTKVISEADGSFHINKIRGDRFILEITSIGYKDTALKVLFNNESFINLGKLKIASLVKPLQPVNVYGQKPLIEQTPENSAEFSKLYTILFCG